MPSFKIDFEAIISAHAELLLDLYELGTPGNLSHLSIETISDMIAEEALDFSEDVLAGVTIPAPGTGKPVLGVAFSDGFKVHIARCALRRSVHALV